MDDIKPAKFPRRDFRNQIIRPSEPRPEPHRKKPHKKRRLVLLIVVLVLIIGAAGGGIWYHRHHKAVPAPISTSPVPKAVAQAVNFPIYYPDPKKLPAGYSLNSSSFTVAVKNGVSYSVSYGNGKKLVFSVQTKPSDAELQTFNSSYIPLRIDYQTPVGQAEIGAYNDHGKVETLVSLPTNTNAWIVITCPYDINQADLKQILSSLRQ
jgi:hypothetical protein